MLEFGEEVWYFLLLGLIGAVFFYVRKQAPSPPKPVVVSSGPKPIKQQTSKAQVDVPSDAKAKIKILFGSQTGTADDFSHLLEKDAKRHGIYAQVVDLELYNIEQLKDESLVIFVMATHGEGEPTDNAKEFYSWLGNKEGLLTSDHLSNLHYTVFGLGNKTYEQYNAVARYVDKKLQELGAKCVFERGEGDDDCSLEEDFNKWKKRMWGPLCKHLGIEASDATDDEKLYPIEEFN